MASSNRHSWPSMFKTKSCVNSTTHHPNWIHHDNNNINSNASQKSGPLSSSGGGEERAPEPKPRWNPRPEQIRILEAIFNSGTVNPSRDEIRKIRSQLQEYGQVGDANVFYWFQNRKSRSKHKQQRHLINNNQKPPKSLPQPPPPPPSPPIFSISSSLPPPAVEKCTPPPFLQNHENDFLKAPFFPVLSQGFNSSFPGHHESHQFLDESSFLLSDFLLGFTTASTKNINAELEEKMMMMKMQQQLLSYSSGANNSTTVSSSTISGANQMNVSSTSFSALSAIHHTHQGACGGVGETCIMSTPPPPPPPIKSSIIFINDVAYEVAMGPFNVRETFGDDAILIHSNGQPVITNEWGVALEPLQHGAFYYLIRTLPPPSPLDTTTTTLTNLV